MKQLFQQLQPQQRLVNILSNETKLTKILRSSGGGLVGYAENVVFDDKVLATHALVVEVACHFEGPKYVPSIHPITKLNSDTLKEIILEA